MNKDKYSRLILFTLLISGVLLGGCLNLAEDVLPPQEIQNTPDAIPSTPTGIPASTPIQEVVDPDQATGVVYVEIIDHSGGLLLSQDIDIKLEGYDDFVKSFEEIQTLPQEGPAIFNDVPLLTGRVYFASVDYGGAVYRTGIYQVKPETMEIILQVSIFETTSDAAGIAVDRIHVLIDYPESESIQISEIIILSNLGDKTVVASDPDQPVLAFSLPEGATDIQFENGSLGLRFIKTADGFGDTVSIPPGPGVYQVLVHYRLPYRGSKLDFSQIMNYPVSAVVAMVPAGELKIRGNFFQDLGVQSIPSGDVQVYNGGGVAKGEKLEFRITGMRYSLSENPITDILELNPYILLIGIIGIGLILAGIIVFFRNLKFRQRGTVSAVTQDEKNRLLDSIIALEDLYNEGEISENDYHRKRQELKQKLNHLVQGKS